MRAEILEAGPNLVGMAGVNAGDVLKIGGGLLIAASGTLSAFRAYRRVQEGHVGIRTFNGKALEENGKPLHPLLRPGGHWMWPFFHDIEMVNVQSQTTAISTRVDLGPANRPTQYDLEAVASWGVILQPGNGNPRPDVDFMDAYNYFYGVDSMEDLEAKVAGASTEFLCECAEELDDDSRDRGTLNTHANQNVDSIRSLGDYGVGVREFHITNFAQTGVIRLTSTLSDPTGALRLN